ncbi:hypothetical protein [Deinococcus irradiatisoli]|nr:hypothetical protein [Deinococcus irradiatisoli]
MSHDAMLAIERDYMRLAALEYPTRAECQLLSFFQSLMRDRKTEWEQGV